MKIQRIVKFEVERDPKFAKWVSQTVGGERIRHCLQCGLCSGSCPLSLYMDYTPRRLMHLSREGFKEEVLSSLTIWLCTCCYACMVECPKKINITHMMYALKERAITEGFYPKRLPMPVLARSFARSIRRHGRITESWLIMRVFLQTAIFRLFGMSKLGLRLMRAGRMPLIHDNVAKVGDVRKMLDTVVAAEEELAI
ncbi:MAG: 4Fe-4S dicluster domain-containing protein [Terriglobia bacterium]|jgi:heterodisulfide reductase subunit C|nr:4Fe-4S dicluster domain-containing protein [Terriglobia bacterium]